MTEAIFSLIVRKIRCFGKTKTHNGVLYLKKKKRRKIYTGRDLLTKKSSIDRIIFQKRYIEICLRNMRHLLDNAA